MLDQALRGSPWQRLYFRPDPQGHWSLRPTPANGLAVESPRCSTLRRGRILQLARPALFETRGDRTLRCRATRGRRVRAAALCGGLTAPGRRRVTAPVGGGMPASALTGTAGLLAGAPA